MSPKRLLPVAALSLTAATLIISAPSSAATTEARTSANWAGYSAEGAQFSKVSGSWVQPEANCDTGTGDAAFWVGLGGATQDSQALEQAGTEVDCTSGSPVYSAWYELVPAAPVKFDLAVSPGDKLSTTVGVDGNQVSISMTNQTTGKTASKQLQMDNPDTTSAEWIAEAPSACQGGSLANCTPVALADFGSVDFTNATATSANQTRPISGWNATAMQLSPSEDQFASSQGGSGTGAVPTDLTSDGSGFTVSTQSGGGEDQQTTTPDGSGYGGGYGDGGYSVDPYGSGSGDGGYGYSGGGGYGYSNGGGYGDGSYSWGGGDPGYGYSYGY
jgi:hypothetical protein